MDAKEKQAIETILELQLRKEDLATENFIASNTNPTTYSVSFDLQKLCLQSRLPQSCHEFCIHQFECLG